MQKEQDFYINFLDGPSSVKQFCNQVLEVFTGSMCEQWCVCLLTMSMPDVLESQCGSILNHFYTMVLCHNMLLRKAADYFYVQYSEATMTICKNIDSMLTLTHLKGHYNVTATE